MIKLAVREIARFVKFAALLVLGTLGASLMPGDRVGGNVLGTLVLAAGLACIVIAIRVPLRADRDR